MQCRGFDGRIRVSGSRPFARADAVFLASWSLTFVVFRVIDVPLILGRFLMGVF
jgi:cobalt/nickel transport system permease protein